MWKICYDRYPPFPEVIAFGKDRKKSGIACHHPKLFMLQREDSLRVVITSANLVESQVLLLWFTLGWGFIGYFYEKDYLFPELHFDFKHEFFILLYSLY